MEGPRVSVAMPVRDAGPWLGECLDSLFAQSETRFELLAVDDGSTDASRAMLEDAARRDARVRVLETRAADRGIAAALNLALATVRAPLLTRMDADDRMHPDRLAAQLAALEADPALFAVSCRASLFPAGDVTDGMRAYVDWQNSLASPGEIACERFIESPVLHPSVTMRTAVVRDVLGGWRGCGWPEDWDFFLRAMEAGLRLARVPEVLLDWRVHGAQSTRTHPHYSLDSLMACRAHFLARHLAGVAASDRSIFVLGAGPVGKALVKALAREGCVAHGLADVDPRKIGGVVRGAGRRWRVVEHTTLEAMAPRPFAVSAVAGAVARRRVRAELGRWGWKEEADFLVAA